MGRKLAVAFSPVVPSEPGAAEVAFAIIDDAVLAGTASSKIEKVESLETCGVVLWRRSALTLFTFSA
jgi:hypothetical protein